jgi:hypothetical protein
MNLNLAMAMEIEAYQAYLEGHRADPDDEHLWEDLQKAKRAMQLAWLNLQMAAPARAPPG